MSKIKRLALHRQKRRLPRPAQEQKLQAAPIPAAAQKKAAAKVLALPPIPAIPTQLLPHPMPKPKRPEIAKSFTLELSSRVNGILILLHEMRDKIKFSSSGNEY